MSNGFEESSGIGHGHTKGRSFTRSRYGLPASVSWSLCRNSHTATHEQLRLGRQAQSRWRRTGIDAQLVGGDLHQFFMNHTVVQQSDSKMHSHSASMYSCVPKVSMHSNLGTLSVRRLFTDSFRVIEAVGYGGVGGA